MGRAGRKNRYHTHVEPYFEKILMWRREGYAEYQVAAMLGVGASTFEKYKVEHEELRELMKHAKADLIADLEKSLYQRAKGMEYEEVKTLIEKVDGKEKKKVERTKKLLPPDTAALIFSLKNLNPQKWKDKHDHEFNANIGVTIIDDVGGDDE